MEGRLLLDDRFLGDCSSLSPLAVRSLDFEEDNLEEEDPRSDFDLDELEEEDLRSDFDLDNLAKERFFFDSLSPSDVRSLDFEEDNLEEEDLRSDLDLDNLEEELCFFDSFLSIFFVDSWLRSSDFFFLLGDSFTGSMRSSSCNEDSESSLIIDVSALLACLNFFFKNFTVSSSTSLAFALSSGVSPFSFTTSIDSGAASANIFAVSAEAG